MVALLGSGWVLVRRYGIRGAGGKSNMCLGTCHRCRWEAEPRKQRRIEEGGDLGDPLALERQHGDAAREEALPLLVPAVVPERQLPVRASRHEAPAVFARQHMVLQERGHRLAAAV